MVFTDCQVNENPCSNQKTHMLIEHRLNFKILKMSPEIFARCYKESVVNQTDHFADAFVRKNVVYGYDVVMRL